VLEIVEAIPGRLPSDAPSIRTLLYPIDIRVVRSEPIDAMPVIDGRQDRSGQGGAGGNPHSGNRNRNGRGQGRRGGRKRRRTDPAPEGRADGMAIDSTGWASSRPGRSDGVSVGSFWCSALASAAAPPPAQPIRSWREERWPPGPDVVDPASLVVIPKEETEKEGKAAESTKITLLTNFSTK
jgi:hypothetical protein